MSMCRMLLAVFVSSPLFIAAGCVVWPIYDPGKVDLSKYDRLRIVPFEPGPEAVKLTASRNQILCGTVRKHAIKSDPPAFKEVTVEAGPVKGQANDLILTGKATKYDPGNQASRAMLIGFGAASFEIEVILKDGASDEILSKSHVSSLFVMGGLIGGVVGEDVFVEDLGRAIGGGVANAKKDSVRRKREEPIAARSGADGHETPGESIPAGGGPK